MGTSVQPFIDCSVRAAQRGYIIIMAHDLNNKDIERAKFAFDIYDFEGKARMDMFYLGDCLRGLNLNPTLKMISNLGGSTKKGEKFIKLEECCDPEDDDGFIPYEPFLKRVCAGPHPEMYEDWQILQSHLPAIIIKPTTICHSRIYNNFSIT